MTQTTKSTVFQIQYRKTGSDKWDAWKHYDNKEDGLKELTRTRELDSAGWAYRLVTYDVTRIVTSTRPVVVREPK